MVTEGVIMFKCGFIEKEGMVVPLTFQPKCRLGENIKIGHNYQASDECLSSCGYVLNQRGKYLLW